MRDDGQRLLEPDVRPGLAGVGRLVDAVALEHVAAQLGLAHPDVDDVRVRLGDGDRADRGGLEEAIGDGTPRQAAVGRLPQPAAGGAEVVLERPAGAAGHRLRAAAARGSERSPAQAGEQRRIDARGWRRSRPPPAPAPRAGASNAGSTGRPRPSRRAPRPPRISGRSPSASQLAPLRLPAGSPATGRSEPRGARASRADEIRVVARGSLSVDRCMTQLDRPTRAK